MVETWQRRPSVRKPYHKPELTSYERADLGYYSASNASATCQVDCAAQTCDLYDTCSVSPCDNCDTLDSCGLTPDCIANPGCI
jgi:hypothetical protein